MADAATCTIDDLGPLPVHSVATSAEVGERVREASQKGQAVYPLGGRTHLGIGMPPSKPGIALDLSGLKQVIDYPARDMTITLQAGITVAELQRMLAQENQRLPIDVPAPERATLGGIIAVNASGPRRLSSGTLRDYIIGITTINDEGQETKAGGRVVKNVAGYDICKLHVGALGTLGIVTQVTLKLRPLPECQALVTLGCQPDKLASLIDLIHSTRTRPALFDLLNAQAAQAIRSESGLGLPDAPWVVVVGYEDNGESVTWQLQQLLKEIGASEVHGVEARAGDASEPLSKALEEFISRPFSRLGFKANLLPSAVATFCVQAVAALPGVLLHAHAGSGIVRGHWTTDASAEQASQALKPLRDAAVAAKGNLVLPHCPVEWKRMLPVWGQTRGDAWLMRQVKDKLDPRHLFNPGRFIDGI